MQGDNITSTLLLDNRADQLNSNQSHRKGFGYTQTKVKQHHVFGDTVLEVAERKLWVMEIKYFEFYCTFYYFYLLLKTLRAKMIL